MANPPRRQRREVQPPPPAKKSETRDIRLFIAGLSVAPLELAVGQLGFAGKIYFIGLLCAAAGFILVALGWNRIVAKYPAIKGWTQPFPTSAAFLGLVIAIAGLAWMVDVGTHIQILSGTTTSQTEPKPILPVRFVPTHLELKFGPHGENPPTTFGKPLGGNIWSWSVATLSVNTRQPNSTQTILIRAWTVSIIFAEPTGLHGMNIIAREKPLPPYQIAFLDARSAMVQFLGDMSGVTVDFDAIGP